MFPEFSALNYAWFFFLIPPLVLFYFLKLKRPRKEIPSLALWQQVINDQRVNSPFQKFKRNILLLIQLLLLCMLILGAMQPFISANSDKAEYIPILVDCSASMAAQTEEGGQTQLDVAKQRIREVIDNLLPEQRMTIISFASTASRLTEFTDNRRVLYDALDSIEVQQVPSRINDVLRLAEGLSRSFPIDTVVMYTDGNIPGKVDVELPFQLNYQQLPPSAANLGVSSISAQRASPSEWDVFVRVKNSHHGQSAASINITQNNVQVGSEQLLLEANESERLVFRVESSTESQIKVQLAPSQVDSLTSDNVAYLLLPKPRNLDVYISPELGTYRHGFQALEGINLYPEPDSDNAAPIGASYDLMISDIPEESAIDATVAFFVGVVPSELKEMVTIETGSASIVDWDRSSPVLQHVQLSQVQTTDEPHVSENIEDKDFEERGHEILIHSQTGPLLLQKRAGKHLIYHLLFHTSRSTFPYRLGFPILLNNLRQVALQQADLAVVEGARTGVLAPLNVSPDTEFSVADPEGKITSTKSNPDGVLSGISAPYVGQYKIESTTGERNAFVSLLDEAETSVESKEEIQFPELSVAAAEERVKSDKPLWYYLAIIGFVLLLLEWWYFQRRPGGYVST